MTSLSKSKHWVNIICNGNKKKISDKMTLKNVSSDFIKGIYCALNDPVEDEAYEDDIIVKSDLDLHDCISEDVIASWGDGNYFEQFCGLNMDEDGNYIERDYDEHDSYRSKILKNPKKYNARWQKFVIKYPDELIKIPTKRFFAFIQGGEINYIIQFDSIDFLNGFEIMRLWIDSQLTWYYSLYLTSIFDSEKVCRSIVTYPTSQKEKSDLLYIFECINVHLPKVLAEKVICILAQQCHVYDKKCHDTYDECHTLCLRSACHIHQKNPKDKILRLKDCLARIQLEQL